MIHSPPPPALLSATGWPAGSENKFLPFKIFTVYYLLCQILQRHKKRDKINAFIHANRSTTFNRAQKQTVAHILIGFHLSFACLIMTEMTPSGIKNTKRTGPEDSQGWRYRDREPWMRRAPPCSWPGCPAGLLQLSTPAGSRTQLNTKAASVPPMTGIFLLVTKSRCSESICYSIDANLPTERGLDTNPGPKPQRKTDRNRIRTIYDTICFSTT